MTQDSGASTRPGPFTWGSEDAMAALLAAMTDRTTDEPSGDGHKSRHQHVVPFELSVGPEDFDGLIHALREFAGGLGAPGSADAARRVRAQGLLGSIAEHYGVEWI